VIADGVVEFSVTVPDCDGSFWIEQSAIDCFTAQRLIYQIERDGHELRVASCIADQGK
jgi:hypothetical protein